MALEKLLIRECPAAFVEFAKKHNALVGLLAGAQGTGGLKVTVSETNMVLEFSGPLTVDSLNVTGAATIGGSLDVGGDAFFAYLETSTILADTYDGGFEAQVEGIVDSYFPITSADVSDFAVAAAAAAPVQSVAGKTGVVTLTAPTDIGSFNTAAASAAPVQSVAGRTGTVTLTSTDISDFDDRINDLIADVPSIDVIDSTSKVAKVMRHPANYVTPTDYPAILKAVTASGNITLDTTGLVLLKTGGLNANIAFASLTHNLAIDDVAICNSGTPANIDTLASTPY